MISLYFVTILALSSGQEELFKNPNFEEDFDGQNNWWCNNCQLQKSPDAHQGTQSGMVSQRVANWAGVAQYVPLLAGRTYHFSAYIKMLNQQPGYLWHTLDFILVLNYADGSPQYHQYLSKSPHMRQANGWMRVGGDFKLTAGKEITTARFYAQFQEKEINYLIDTASLTEVTANPNWEQEANDRIEQIRKRDIQLRLNADMRYNPNQMYIEINQTKHHFAFGSAVKSGPISGTDSSSLAYQNTFYNMFEWAVIENALKWRQMEWNRGQINYDNAEKALDALESKGVPVRGHCVIWGVEANIPEWLKPMDGPQVQEEVNRRIEGVVGRMKDRLAHWDVNNEQLHGPFFENKVGDALYTESVFRNVSSIADKVKLFFNEYAIINEGTYTYAYVEQVKHAVANGVPVYGLGAQGHMPVEFDIETVKKRLDVIATAGVPVWITELTVQSPDRNVRAEGYANLLRLCFSYPSVEGVLLWGFWDGAHYNPSAALVEGDNFQLNAAGQRYMDLVHGEWRTYNVLFPELNLDTTTIRGFHGNYTLKVFYQNNQIQTQHFYVAPGEGAVTVDINVL